MRLPLSGHYLEWPGRDLALLIAAAAVLQIGGGVGIAYVAGFSAVRAVLFHFHWLWFIAMLGGLAASFVGYYFAYLGIYQVKGGPDLSTRQFVAVVAAGFAGFFAHGGSALDQYALEAAGADKRQAKVRVSSLAGLEHGVLAIGGTAAAIVLLLSGRSQPPLDFTLPWAVIPIPGFLIGFWVANHHRDRFRDQPGWRGKLGVFLDSIYLIRELFVHPREYWAQLLGMAAFWFADAFAAWAGLAFFGYKMNWAALFIGFATGMVFTRRTGPLGGAGVLEVVLPVTVWASGAPFAVAVVGLFAYRVFALWSPLPPSLAALPTLRRMGRERVPHAEGIAGSPGEPALRHGGAQTSQG